MQVRSEKEKEDEEGSFFGGINGGGERWEMS